MSCEYFRVLSGIEKFTEFKMSGRRIVRMSSFALTRIDSVSPRRLVIMISSAELIVTVYSRMSFFNHDTMTMME